MKDPTAGYSGTPLAKKLGIKPESRIFAVDPPANYGELLAPLPEGTRIVTSMSHDTDIVHVFTLEKAKLARALKSALKGMRQDAAIWVSWPKRASGVPTDVTEDVVRELALPLGLVDIKVCAIDSVWSGLKLVVRRENRRG